MATARDLSAFARAPWRRRALALEAVWELLRARIDTARPATHYTRHLGDLKGKAVAPDPDQVARAAEIGHMVARVAPWMPVRAVCLQQALAVRRMLRRRGLPAVVHLGLARAPRDGQREAHAWVKAGSTVISGDVDLDRFVVVGEFS